ncbi:MAG TPA: formylglycine-generating enzyme family protein [Steroidobacteraceae bacterium]|nr:formylglycine-generating enzyme family protein [Steroidobacteraceae bacterium]
MPTPSRRPDAAPVSTPSAPVPGAPPVSGEVKAAAPARAPPPLSTPAPPVEKIEEVEGVEEVEEPVGDSNRAQSGLRGPDDWSDLVISEEDVTPDPVAAGRGPRGRGVLRGWMALVIGLCAAALLLAAVAWFRFHMRPAPTPAKAAVPAVPAEAAPTAGTLIRDCPTCAAMIVLPAARFKQGLAAADRGSSFEMPQRWVDILRPFALSVNLVTVDEYRRFIDATGRAMRGCETYDRSWSYRADHNWRNPGFAQSGLHPVTCVSWNDAAAYAQWLSARTGHRYRLPSSSEWEYAARAGGEAVYPWTSNGANACAFANVADASAKRRYPGWAAFACDDGYPNTSPVGSFKANSWGLNDMLGNVLQWTEDCWHADYRGAPMDGSARTDGDCSERELRGSSWFTAPAYVRATYRNHFAADYRASSVGIRLARDVGS